MSASTSSSKHSNEFVDYIVDLLAPWAEVRAKRMFGGYGVYRGKLMFGIIADNTLYFKADASTIPDFEAAGMGPFTYTRQGKELALKYYQVPEDALEDEAELIRWAAAAYGVARDMGK